MHPASSTTPRVRLLVALGVLAVATGCGALRVPLALGDQRDDTLAFPPAEEPVPSEQARIPLEDDADWVQLVSGEWLRGKLVRIRDGMVHFDSDELDDQTLELADVESIRTARPQVLVTDANRTLRGRLVLEGDGVWIEGARTVRIGRDEVLATLALDGEDAADWSGKVTLGATLRSGNTTQNDFSAFAQATRETARTRWKSTYNGVLSRARGIETANNHRLRSIHDVFLTRRLFLTVPVVEAFRDRFQNIEYRFTLGAAIGYEIVDGARHDWSLSVGPAYQYTRFDTVEPDESDHDSTGAAVVVSQYSWDVASNVDFDFDYSITAAVPDTQEYNHNFVMKLSVDLVGDLDLDIAFVWDRVNRPAADGDGNLPEKDDYRTTIGLGWSF